VKAAGLDGLAEAFRHLRTHKRVMSSADTSAICDCVVARFRAQRKATSGPSAHCAGLSTIRRLQQRRVAGAFSEAMRLDLIETYPLFPSSPPPHTSPICSALREDRAKLIPGRAGPNSIRSLTWASMPGGQSACEVPGKKIFRGSRCGRIVVKAAYDHLQARASSHAQFRRWRTDKKTQTVPTRKLEGAAQEKWRRSFASR